MKNICNSCSLPIGEKLSAGTNADGSLNNEYCELCYKKGHFVDQGVSVDQKIEQVSREYMTRFGWSEENAKETARLQVPTMDRWNNYKAKNKKKLIFWVIAFVVIIIIQLILRK